MNLEVAPILGKIRVGVVRWFVSICIVNNQVNEAFEIAAYCLS
jgi:hypothetical protein